MSRYVVRYGNAERSRVFETNDILHLRDFLMGVREAGFEVFEAMRDRERFDVRPLEARSARPTKNPGRV